MTKGQVRFLLLLTAALTVWHIFKIPGVATAFWAFCTAGIIPGTTRAMTPEATMRILCVLFGISTFIIFRKEFFQSLRASRPKSKNITAIGRKILTAATGPPTSMHRNQIILILQKQQQKRAWAFAGPILQALVHSLLGLAKVVSLLERGLRATTRYGARYVRLAAQTVYRFVQKTVRISCHFGCRLARVAVILSVYLWRQAEPHIRDFDRWLDAELHRNPKSAQVLRGGAECGKALQDSYQRMHSKARKLFDA